jgi:D-serine deaminase-like pyridoxal phosphate-dependent protein
MTPRDKAEIPTPALLVDLEAFDANVGRMAAHCRKAGRAFRPHAKTHKCPKIAERLVAAGAAGVCVATAFEAEAMLKAGLSGVLLTSPIVEAGKIARLADLADKPGRLMFAVGHARQVELLAQAAGARHRPLEVLIDIDVGDKRTGVLPGEPAAALYRAIAAAGALTLRGIQAYAGHASHVVGFEARRKSSQAAWAKALETRALLVRAGATIAVVSGGSTGTYNIDTAIEGVTELQVGSFMFMDVDYRRIGSADGNAVYLDFAPSLSVLTTVVSTSHADCVSVDAGIKAFATDVPFAPEARDRRGTTYRRTGDEFGRLTAEAGELPRLGERLEFLVPHCDPTVNLYDRIYACRGERVEAVWPIVARKENTAC